MIFLLLDFVYFLIFLQRIHIVHVIRQKDDL